MLIRTKAIVIGTIKYQDKSLIVRCFTQSEGMKTYFVRDAFSSKKQLRAAYFLPFTLLDIEADHKPKNNLQYFKSVKPYIYQSIHTDITKNAMIIFLAEIFGTLFKEEEQNQELFLFLETSLLWLDQQSTSPNFHLIVLIEITKFLGFYPQLSENHFFELNEGVFISNQTLNCLNKEDSNLIRLLIGQRINTTTTLFTNIQRRELLNILLQYYACHIENFRKPKSLDVLKEIFS